MKNKFINRIISLALIGALSTVGFIGCGSSSNTDSADNTTDIEAGSPVELNTAKRLNIATQPAPGYLPIQIAWDNGWVEEALAEAGYGDVEVTYTEFESGPPENESFAAGQQDIGVMGNVPSILGKASGQDRVYLGISENGEKTEVIIVPEASDIKNVADLKGKKIGLVVGSICENLVYNVLKTEGLTLDDVELVNLATSEQQAALAAGQVDAVATWQPTVAKLTADGSNRRLIDGENGLFKAENTIFGNREYVEQNPEIVQIFIQQYARAAYELANNKEKYSEQYAEKYGLTTDLLYAALEDANFPIVIEQDDIDDLQGTADFLYETGKASTQVTIKDFVNDTFVNDETVKAYLNGEK
ncbi:sulfonate transport system substrate-binding protein [Pseudobutyrivibrio sp. YE44]|uniref:aliphatic sulfonate ABC transporter substrate-binding protein n=1 Tax=Pseudobutyrivibrio sp. YE44 TaxID=1520802 RepID=UPI0008927A33|nr:aliphatic sulfonate ABC transporter substrate-binding protein [Pseudobutyrivibrio sp. YE44]SDB14902.1 sulfonate transport system substrate-binding protein [Pseudobutyrivibrio sp. YE44]